MSGLMVKPKTKFFMSWFYQVRKKNGETRMTKSASDTAFLGHPAGLGWLIAPVIRDLPRESLIATLTSTRNYSLTFKTR